MSDLPNVWLEGLHNNWGKKGGVHLHLYGINSRKFPEKEKSVMHQKTFTRMHATIHQRLSFVSKTLARVPYLIVLLKLPVLQSNVISKFWPNRTWFSRESLANRDKSCRQKVHQAEIVKPQGFLPKNIHSEARVPKTLDWKVILACRSFRCWNPRSSRKFLRFDIRKRKKTSWEGRPTKTWAFLPEMDNFLLGVLVSQSTWHSKSDVCTSGAPGEFKSGLTACQLKKAKKIFKALEIWQSWSQIRVVK